MKRVKINTDIISRGDKILVALSGGADSVFLTHVLASQRHELGIDVAAAHFSHGIRKDAAESERQLAENLCNQLGIELFVGRGDTPAYIAEHKLSLEEGARELRYAFLQETLAEIGFSLIATAHNLGDNSETALFNMTRGGGLMGLAGIAPKNGNVIRPILHITRGEIEEYLAHHNLAFATDHTNFDVAYSRNRIRLNILPELRAINPRADENIYRNSVIARETYDFMCQMAQEKLPTERRAGAAPLDVINNAPNALRRYIYEVLIGEINADKRVLDYTNTEKITELCHKARVSSRLMLGGGITAAITYYGLEFSNEDTPELSNDKLAILNIGEAITWNGWHIEIGDEDGREFCADMLEPPFFVRARQTGDVIPMAGGHKSVKKILIDKKIDMKSRDRMPLICDNRGVLLLGDIERDLTRLYRGEGARISINCRRISGHDE